MHSSFSFRFRLNTRLTLPTHAAQVMKKYKAAVAQLSVDQLTLQDQAGQLTQLEAERTALREQLAEQATRLDALQGETASAHDQRRLELRVRELESRCEFEQTTKLRLETQAARLKEAVEKAGGEAEQARQREQQTADQLRKLHRQVGTKCEESVVKWHWGIRYDVGEPSL